MLKLGVNSSVDVILTPLILTVRHLHAGRATPTIYYGELKVEIQGVLQWFREELLQRLFLLIGLNLGFLVVDNLSDLYIIHKFLISAARLLQRDILNWDMQATPEGIFNAVD